MVNFAHLILNILSQLQKTIIPLNAPILHHFTKKDHSILYLWPPLIVCRKRFSKSKPYCLLFILL